MRVKRLFADSDDAVGVSVYTHSFQRYFDTVYSRLLVTVLRKYVCLKAIDTEE